MIFKKSLVTLTLLFCSAVFSKDQLRYQFLRPGPKAILVPYESSIIICFDSVLPSELANLNSFIQLNGSMSGKISGTTRVASDGRTILFNPKADFLPGEIISVSLKPAFPGSVGNVPEMDYQFTVAKEEFSPSEIEMTDESEDAAPQVPGLAKSTMLGAPTTYPNGVSVPSDFPHIQVTVNKATADGYIFLNNWRDFHPYDIIFANDGSPVWYMRTADGDRRRDFKVQKNGVITMLCRQGGNHFLGYDINFNQIKSYSATNGYNTDEHELQVLENGNYLLIGIRGLQVDMSKYLSGGQKSASLSVGAIQEFTPQGDLIFLWDAFDHLMDYLPYTELDDPRSASFRFPHMNSVDIDEDGNLLLSCRHLSTVFKINRQTGDIIWRLGGEFNEFTFVNDPLDGFRNQHDIRVLGNGHYSVFDNGNLHNPSRSRGAEYVIDTEKMTATLVWEYRNPAGTNYSYYMGNTQRLGNGNTLIDWAVGDRPKATEVTPAGQVVYEMNFVDGYDCYRAFRFPWNGVVAAPTLFVESASDKVSLVFNKFGDKTISYYKIYSGLAAHPTTVIDTSRATLKHLTNLQNGKRYYFRVTAIDSSGKESAFSNEENVLVQILPPGQNMILNGDFSQGNANWVWQLQDNASADWLIESGTAHFAIQTGGAQVYDVQLRQNGYALTNGKEYVFEFDAWADTPRTIEAKVGQDSNPFTNYSKIGLTYITNRSKHYSYTFKMEDPSDNNARVVFNSGTSDADVYLDNVSLKSLGQTSIAESEASRPGQFALIGNYPNPFNAQTAISFYVPVSSKISIELYDLLGRRQRVLVDDFYATGEHEVRLDGAGLGSGIYFYRMSAKDSEGKSVFTRLSKMILVK